MKTAFQKLINNKHKNIYFLVALFLLFVVSAFTYNLKSHALFEDLGLSLVAIAAIYSFYSKKHQLFFGIFLAVVLIASNWMDEILKEYMIFIKLSFTLLFFSYILTLTLKKLFATKEISMNSIIGVINGFIVLGIIAGTSLLVIHTIWPDSIVFVFNEPNIFLAYIYFGFVTITTLGFGDIIPLTPPGQLGVIIFSVLGQMYLATIIASFVGKYSAMNHSRKSED